MTLPVIAYDGPVHLVTTDAGLHSALEAIRHERVVGFDTETRPTFKKGQSHTPSLVQIAGSQAVYLFQIKRLDCSHVLAAIFDNPHILKTGVALSRDLTDLQKVFPFQPANMLDLGDIASLLGYQQTGLRNLVGIFLGRRITKGAQTSNWAAATLTSRQITYAATDAWVCRQLYLKFEADGLLTAAAAERERRRRARREPPPSKTRQRSDAHAPSDRAPQP
jgi:ribonuclease D